MNRNAWNVTIATDHTAGAPPSFGKTILVNIGWTANSSMAETKSVTANSVGMARRMSGDAASIVESCDAVSVAVTANTLSGRDAHVTLRRGDDRTKAMKPQHSFAPPLFQEAGDGR